MEAASLVRFISSAVIVLGSFIGYIPQYFEIQRRQDESGFSTGVSCILLIANIMRIFFWFGKSFELTLLYQSIAVIICQLGMLSLCISVRNSRHPHQVALRKKFTDWDWTQFWSWAEFESYIQCLLTLLAMLLALQSIVGDSVWYVEGLGSVSLAVESILALPQAYQNYTNKSTVGLNLLLIVGWLVGDAFKTVYFFTTEAPVQFLASGCFQVLTDLYILLQMFVLYAPVAVTTPTRRPRARSEDTPAVDNQNHDV